MIVKLLTEYYLEFLRLKGGCRASSESTLVKMSNCWKSHAAALVLLCFDSYSFWCCGHLDEEERVGCFALVVFLMWLLVFCGSSSWCHGLVCSV